MKILILTRYGRLGASSRVRFFQYLYFLDSAGLDYRVSSFISDQMLTSFYASKKYSLFSILNSYFKRVRIMFTARDYDLLWIEKEALPWMPLWLERFFLREKPYVLDYDDAIFHQYENNKSRLIRVLLGRRIDELMRNAVTVVGGNEYLMNRAVLAGSSNVKKIPTVIDLDRYHDVSCSKLNHRLLPRIVWIGTPSTIHYLEIVRPILVKLSMHYDFILRVIGCDEYQLSDVNVEHFSWTESSEVQSISDCQIGIMPLIDSAWERGKCGYKLIQYMACGLPVIASNVGVNQEIVKDGENGFLVSTPNEWFGALGRLLQDQNLRMQMGSIGRQRVVNEFCIQQTGPQLAELLRSACGVH